MIFQVPYWDVANVWPRVSGCVQKALARQNEWRLTDMLEQITSQRMQLWVVPWKIAVVTQVLTYPGARICMVVLCGGEGLVEHKDAFDEIERWAGSIGCDEMRLQGRKGWQRVYPGYEPIATVMRKRL